MKNYLLPVKISRIYSVKPSENGLIVTVEKGETFTILGVIPENSEYAVFTPNKQYLYSITSENLEAFLPGSED